MNNSTTLTKIAPALLKAQQETGNAVKDSKNPFFKSKFADLNSVREAVTPALNKNGITLLQPTVVIETGMPGTTRYSVVRTTLLHESGEFISGDTEIVCAKQNDPQAYGAATSYARRYGLSSLLSVGAEDSDAEGAMNRTPDKNLAASANGTSSTTSNGNTGFGGGSFRKPKTETAKTNG